MCKGLYAAMQAFPSKSRRLVVAAIGACSTFVCWWWVQHRPKLAAEAAQRFKDWDQQQANIALGARPTKRDFDDIDDDIEDDDGMAPINGISQSGIHELFAMLFPGIYYGKTWAKWTQKQRRSTTATRLATMVC